MSSYLSCLCSHTVNSARDTLAALTKNQKALVLEFSAVGLVYIEEQANTNDRVQFYPSYIAINMMFKSFGPQTQSLHNRTQVGNEGEEGAMQLNGLRKAL